MFGKKTKNVSNEAKTKASDMTSGSKSTKSCGAKSTTSTKASATKSCGGKCKTKNTSKTTKSCS